MCKGIRRKKKVENIILCEGRTKIQKDRREAAQAFFQHAPALLAPSCVPTNVSLSFTLYTISLVGLLFLRAYLLRIVPALFLELDLD